MTTSTTLFRKSEPKAKYLLVVNKGPGAEELKREGAAWDLLEIYFMKADIEAIESGGKKTDAEYVVFETDRAMRKFAILKRIFEKNDFWKSYAAIMMADDDLIPVGCTIKDVFDLFMKTGLRVGQPALSEESYWSHEITLRNPAFHWRKTNFVEVMCPIMTPEALEDYLPIFAETVSGFGLDHYWSQKEQQKNEGLAILDDTPLRHCRSIRGGMAYQGLAPEAERRQFFKKRGLHSYMQKTLSGHTQAGSFEKKSIYYREQAIQSLKERIKDLLWLLSEKIRSRDSKKKTASHG